MDSTVAAGLIAGASTLAGTLGTQSISAWREARRDKATADRARTDALLGIAEEAALALTRTIAAIDAALVDAGDAGLGTAGQDKQARRAAAWEDYSGKVRALWELETRLAVRVHSDRQLIATFRAAVSEVSRAYSELSRLRYGGGLDTADLRRVRDARADAFAAQNTFQDEAAAVLGPDLPASREAPSASSGDTHTSGVSSHA